MLKLHFTDPHGITPAVLTKMSSPYVDPRLEIIWPKCEHEKHYHSTLRDLLAWMEKYILSFVPSDTPPFCRGIGFYTSDK